MTGIANFGSDLENETQNETKIPPKHEFVVNVYKVKSGKKAGQDFVKVKLYIEPFIFKRTRTYKGVITFICNDCEMKGKFLPARAQEISIESYILIEWPTTEDHICFAKTMNILSERRRKK